jgi:hypothetical protein
MKIDAALLALCASLPPTTTAFGSHSTAIFGGIKTPKALSPSFSYLGSLGGSGGSSSVIDVATVATSNGTLDKDASDLGSSQGSFSFWELFKGVKAPKEPSPSFSYLGRLGASNLSSSSPEIAASKDTLDDDASIVGASESSSTFSDVATSDGTVDTDASNLEASGGSSSLSDVVSAYDTLHNDASKLRASKGASGFATTGFGSQSTALFKGFKTLRALSPSFSYLGSLGASQGSSSVSDAATSNYIWDKDASALEASEGWSSYSDVASAYSLRKDASNLRASEGWSSFATTTFRSKSTALFKGFRTPRALSPSFSYLGSLGAYRGSSSFSDVATSTNILDMDASYVRASGGSSSFSDVAASTYTLDKDASNLEASKGSSSFSDVATVATVTLDQGASDKGLPSFFNVATSYDTLDEEASKTKVNDDASSYAAKSMASEDSAKSDYMVR